MTETQKPNLPLLRKVLDHIDKFPEQWDQGWWGRKSACGTVCCLAGWACILSGHELEFGECRTIAHVAIGDRYIENIAAEELGVTAMEAQNLFHINIGRSDIQLVAEQIAARVGETL